MSILDDPLITGIVFYPRKVNKPNNLPDNCQLIEFEVDGAKIGGLYFLKDKSLPTMLFFHGNGEICTDYIHYYKKYTYTEVNFAVVDFRGYGFSSSEPNYSNLISDSLPIYNQMRTWLKSNEMTEEIIVMGRSLGSVCASEIGGHNPDGLLGIIYESGFASVYHLMKKVFMMNIQGITPEMLEPWSNEIRIKNIKKPVLVIHGGNDQLIPITEARLIIDTLPENTSKRLLEIKGAGHNNIMMFEDEYFDTVKEFNQKIV